MSELHHPDRQPDLIQQIEHGVRYLMNTYKACGHIPLGVISPTLKQYVHLGDAMSMTDNQIYHISKDMIPTPRYRRGEMDDRWVFTDYNPVLQYQAIQAFAAASRSLAGYNPSLSVECIRTAKALWNDVHQRRARNIGSTDNADKNEQEYLAAVELFLSTGSQDYRKIVTNRNRIKDNFERLGWSACRALQALNDSAFSVFLLQCARDYEQNLDAQLTANPFELPLSKERNVWGTGREILNFGMRYYYLHRRFPELFDTAPVHRALEYVLGRHPGSHISFVSGVGSYSVTTAYGVNRGDWSYIPGGVVSGTAIIESDLPELKQDWPYLWQQTQYTIEAAAFFIFCSLAHASLLP
ncbi:MAG: glycoside hydrolase family 9 protein [candidate division KSB1 bacterium]|nr:glycoside hydrolase family 9 protein [candidate division KSB1 bacterium]